MSWVLSGEGHYRAYRVRKEVGYRNTHQKAYEFVIHRPIGRFRVKNHINIAFRFVFPISKVIKLY